MHGSIGLGKDSEQSGTKIHFFSASVSCAWISGVVVVSEDTAPQDGDVQWLDPVAAMKKWRTGRRANDSGATVVIMRLGVQYQTHSEVELVASSRSVG